MAVGDIIGVMGGFLVATEQLGFNRATYIKNTVDFLTSQDVISSCLLYTSRCV